MWRFILPILGALLLQTPALAIELTSVAPSKAEPGAAVSLSGGPFTDQMLIYFGTEQVIPSKVRMNRMVFTVPALPPGSYGLHVGNASQSSEHTYTFEVLEPTPQILSISPRRIDSCLDSAEQQVLIRAKGATAQTSVLLNELSVVKDFNEPDRLTFTLQPGMRAGTYGVLLKNPSGATSLPAAIWISDQPTISSVERGGDFVNNYEVIVRGKNFYFNSILTVSQPDDTLSTQRHRPLVLHAHEVNSGLSQSLLTPQADRIVFRNCQTLSYYRYPGDFQNKSLQLQVINPDGKKSNPFAVSLP